MRYCKYCSKRMSQYKDRSSLIEKSVYSIHTSHVIKQAVVMHAFYNTVKQNEGNQWVHPKIILYILISHFQISSHFYQFSLSEPITDKMSDIHPKNTFAVKNDASMKLQVLV